MRLRLDKSYVLDRSVLDEEPLVVVKIFKCSFDFNKCYKNAALQRKGMEIATFLADSH
jgi:hypothetical protein